jgi:TfoX/Sxy family transcriptional regulator of competence genes
MQLAALQVGARHPFPRVGGPMAFDEKLAARIRAHLGKDTRVAERKMFGGIIFLLQGNMCCGVHRDALIVRVGLEEAGRALAEPHTRVFDLTGRPMKAWVLVDPKGFTTAAQLGKWVDRAAKWAGSLPPK